MTFDGPNTPGQDTGVSRRKFLAYGAASAGAALVAACGGTSSSGGSTAAGTSTAAAIGTPKSGGSIKIGISDFFSSDGLDPAKQSSTFGLISSGMLHDTLIRLDGQWNVTPMLATDWSSSADATQWKFKLRQGVVFPTSGKTLDANDVAWSIQHVLATKTASPGQSLFAPVLKASGIKVTDPQTIQFNLTEPDVFFPILLGGWYGRISQANWDFSKGSGGTGPFKSTSFTGGQGFQMQKNPHYWMSGKPYLDSIQGLVISNPATKAQAILSGDFDMVDQPSFDTIPLFEKSTTVTALTGPFGYQMDFGIGGNVAPYNDPRVRQAMKMMIDRQKMVEISCHGQARICADIPINSADPFYPSGLQPPAYDPEQAKSLFKQAGVSNMTAPVYTSPTYLGLNDLSVQFKQFGAAAGVNLDVVSLSTDGWNTHFLKSGILANYWARQHPSTVLQFMATTGGAWNESKMSDPTIDKLVVQARSTKDPAKQKEIYTEILTRYRQESACIWPLTYDQYVPHQKRLQGLDTQVTDLVDFRSASVSA